MDATRLREQVQDIIHVLASNDPNVYSAIKDVLASDAELDVPATKTHGAERIHDIVALHAAFTTNNTVGDIVWAEKTKTATFSAKTTYALPIPGGHVKLSLQWEDITLSLAPDTTQPSQARKDATTYKIAKVSKPHAPRRHPILLAPYYIFVLFFRLFSGLVFDVLVTLHKFFQRNSLSKGLIRTGFAAVYEIFAWGIAFVLAHMPFASYLPFGHRQHKVVEKPASDSTSFKPSAPDVDRDPRVEPSLPPVSTKKSRHTTPVLMKKAKPTTKTTVEKLETQHFSFDRPDLNGLRANLEVVDQVSQVLPEQAVQAVQAESGSKTASRNAPSPPKDKSVPTQPAVETGTSSKNTGKGKKSKTDAQNPHNVPHTHHQGRHHQ